LRHLSAHNAVFRFYRHGSEEAAQRPELCG